MHYKIHSFTIEMNLLGPLFSFGPFPLPPFRILQNFTYEVITSACHHFSFDWCTSEGLSSVMCKASFGDDASSSKKFEVTVTCLHPSTQGLSEFINEENNLASLQHLNRELHHHPWPSLATCNTTPSFPPPPDTPSYLCMSNSCL